MGGIRTRALRVTATVAVAAALALSALLIGATSAGARADDPPSVIGLSISDSRSELQKWNKAVVIAYVPPLESLPAGVDPSSVVVARSEWVNQVVTAAALRPLFRLTLGSRIPDLSGLTRDQAADAIETRGLKFSVSSDPGKPDAVVESQNPQPQSIVEFGLGVTVALAADDEGGVSTTTTTTVMLIAAGSGLGLALLILLGVLTARRVGRRRRTPTVPESIEVKAYHGQLIGPELTEPGPGTTFAGGDQRSSVSVRLEPHYDPGTFTLEEGRR